MEQVLAESPGHDLLAQVAGGGGDHPHVHLHVRLAAHAAETLFHQHPQDAALALPRHVGDLVDVEGAAVGAFEDADLARTPALPFLAEQFDVHALGRHAGSGNGHKFAARTRTGAVDQARRGLLAGPRRPRDQHPAVGRGDLGDHLAKLLGGGGGPHKAVGQDHLGAQSPVLAAQVRGLQGALGHQQQAVGLERLFQEVIGPALDGAHRRFDVAVARNHHHRQVGVQGLDHVQQLQPIHAPALHPDVQHQQGGLARADGRQGGFGVLRRADRIALVLQYPRHQIPDVGLVIDDQNVTGHAFEPSNRFPRSGGLRGIGQGMSAGRMWK